MRKVGAYAKLLANYASDDAIMEVGEQAELLFVRGLAFCATSDSDGFLSESQVLRYVAAGLKNAEQRAKRLVLSGLWVKVDGGYVVRSWTVIHETSEEKGRKLKADRERKRRNPSGVQPESERNPSGVLTPVSTDSLSLIHNSALQDRTEETSLPHKRGQRLPPDWKPTPEDITWQRASTIADDLARRELAKFADYWAAKSGRDAAKLDWSATWRNWLRTAIERTPAATKTRPAGWEFGA